MWKLKLDANGNVVVIDGKPVYINESTGEESALDAPGMHKKIGELNAEAKKHRETADAANAKLQAFGDLDPVAARDAIAKTADIRAGKMIESGKLDELKTEMNKTWGEKLAAQEAATQKLQGQLNETLIGGAFSGSKYIADNITLPGDMMQAHFGKHFKVEDGKVYAYDGNNTRIMSKSNPGEPAGFDEALTVLVGGYAYKDKILKADNKPGGGTPQGGGGGGAGGAKVMKRAAWSQLPPDKQAAHFKDGGSIED